MVREQRLDLLGSVAADRKRLGPQHVDLGLKLLYGFPTEI